MFGPAEVSPPASHHPASEPADTVRDAFSQRLAHLGVAAEDRTAIFDLADSPIDIPARAEIASSIAPSGHIHVLLDGWACKYRRTPDGRRQILAIVLPGEMADIERLPRPGAAIGITAMTGCWVATIAVARMEELRRARPAVADALWMLLARDHATMGEQIVALGRCTSRQRVAHLFCGIVDRLRVLGHAPEDPFRSPLTQTDLADTLGLSTVHINRTLQNLRDSGLIEMRGRAMRIPRLDDLRRAAAFEADV